MFTPLSRFVPSTGKRYAAILAAVALCRPIATASPLAEIEPNGRFALRRVVAAAQPESGVITIGGALGELSLETDITTSGALLPQQIASHDYSGLPAGMPYSAFINNNTGAGTPDVVMRALDQLGGEIAFNDDDSPYGDGFASGFSSTVNADGTIHLEVSGYPDFGFSGDHAEGGDYAVHIQLNSYMETGVLFGDDVARHDFGGLQPGLPYFAYIDNRGYFGEVDTVMQALDAFGNPVAYSDDGSPIGGFFGSAFSSNVTADGAIHLEVSGYPDYGFQGSHTEFGEYFLYVQLGQTGPGIVERGDTDYYSFTGLEPGSAFTAEVVDAQFDTMLHWFDDSGNPIGSDDDGGNDLLSKLPGVVPASGVVNLAVTAYFDEFATGDHFDTGEYNLLLTHGSPISWTATGGGAWSAPGNWTGSSQPNGSAQQARLGAGLTEPPSVVIDSDVTLAALQFDNDKFAYTLASDGVHDLTLAAAAVVDAVAGVHTIAAPLVGHDGLHKVGNGTIVLTGDNTYQGPTIVSRGTLRVDGTHLGGDEYRINSGGTLAGSGVIDADVTVEGTLAPGASPGILHIAGDYTQTFFGTLQIEIGGLAAGAQHDKLLVGGAAYLDGVLEVPIVDGPGQPNYVPALGDVVTFLTADGGVAGEFGAVYSPNLHLVNSQLALRVVASGNEVQIEFVGPDSIEFADQAALAEWSDPNSWLDNAQPGVPETIDVTSVTNQSNDGAPQRIEVRDADAFTHVLSVEDDSAPIIVAIGQQRTLSAVIGVTIGNHGVIELGESYLVSSTIDVASGGQLTGSGTVVGRLTVGGDADAGQFRPGDVEVLGDYQQSSSGELVIEIKSETDYDSVQVAGVFSPGGTLTVVLPSDDSVQPGDVFPIITAESLADGDRFERVVTLGNADLVVVPIYHADGGDAQALSLEQSAVSGADGVVYALGDMNFDFSVDAADVPAFAQALRDPRSFEDGFPFVSGDIIGNIDKNGRGLDFDDIDDFATLLNMSTSELMAAMSIPEPSGFCLGVMTGALAAVRRLAASGPRVRRRSAVNYS
ncbi:MAG: autotransporter-associated beta strand repeat-containing protein [Pirellulales bacterium]|nr:autotransporter-associated beta strand repeat-containing protein [Pirellulales bacterium]